MKKLCFLFALFIVVALSGCSFNKKFECDIESVETVQIVKLSQFDNATNELTCSVLYEVADVTSFLDQLCAIEGQKAFIHNEQSVLKDGDIVIYIQHFNGDYSIIRNHSQVGRQGGAKYYDSFTFDEDAYNALLADYMPPNTLPTNIHAFSLNEEPYYLGMIEEFPSDKYIGAVFTAEEALAHAEREWVALYGDRVNRQKPYKVYFDADTNVWLVRGTLPKVITNRGEELVVKGRLAGILIQKENGKILAVWHD